MFLILRGAWILALFLSFCTLLSVLTWLVCGDGWHTLRVHRRLRRRESSLRRALPWSQRLVAIRRFSNVKLVGIDQVSRTERRAKFTIQ